MNVLQDVDDSGAVRAELGLQLRTLGNLERPSQTEHKGANFEEPLKVMRHLASTTAWQTALHLFWGLLDYPQAQPL